MTGADGSGDLEKVGPGGDDSSRGAIVVVEQLERYDFGGTVGDMVEVRRCVRSEEADHGGKRSATVCTAVAQLCLREKEVHREIW